MLSPQGARWLTADIRAAPAIAAATMLARDGAVDFCRPTSHSRWSLAIRVAFDAQDRYFRSPDFGWKGGRYVAGRHRDFLSAVHRVCDHPAADRAADLLSPQFLAGCRLNRIEIAARVAKQNKAPSGWRHAAQDRIIGLQPPLPRPRVGVGGVKPARPDSVGARELSELVERIEGLLSRPRLPERGSRNFFPGLQPDSGAPFDVGSEDEVGQRVVGRAVPFLPAPRARAKVDVFVDSEGLFRIF